MILKDIINSNDNNIRRNRSKPKGWAKTVNTLNEKQKNGYGVIGDWVNPKTEIKDGQVYLDCSPIEKDSNKMRYSIFSIINGEYKEYGSTTKQQGWAKELWDTMKEALKENELPFSYLYTVLLKEEPNKERLFFFSKALSKSIIQQKNIDEFEEEVYKGDF